MIKKLIANLFGGLFLLIGFLMFALEEPLFGVGTLLLGILLLTPLNRFWTKWFPEKKWVRPALFGGIGVLMIICAASFGRTTYYETEPKDAAVIAELSTHPVQQTALPNGMNYSYIDEGSGPVIVLLHGFPDMASTWDETITDLSRDHRVIAPFMRGYFPTDIAPDDDYAVKTVAEDIVLLLDQLEVGNFTVLGQDWGASVAMVVSNLVSSRIDQVVTVAIPHPTCLIPSPELLVAGRHFLMFGSGDYGIRYARKNEFDYIERLYQRWSPDYLNYTESSDKIIETFKYPDRLGAALGYYRSFAAETAENQAFYNQLPDIPICFMVGENDAIATPEIIEQMRTTMPAGSKTIVFKNAGHFLHRENFPEFITELRAFLPEVEPEIEVIEVIEEVVE